MSSPHWVKAAGNPAAERWLTRPGCRTVLVVVPHMTAGTRLADVVPLVETDSRIQVLYCVPTTTDAWPGVEDYVREGGGLLIPWHQVLRSRFDLALAASYSEIDKIPAPVMVVPHGVGGGRSRYSPWTAPREDRQVQPRDVLVRDGRVVPAAVVVAHESDAERLRRACPEVAERIVVAGDPCYDRIRASMPFRNVYRKALGLDRRHKLVLLSSTWSRYSLFGGDLEVWRRVLDELPADEYRVVAALHPNIWAVHGRRQVLAWLADHMAAGLAVVPPEEGWRAALVAADFVIGDHGSVTQYGAALGVPVLVNPASAQDVPDGSNAALLRRMQPVVDTTGSIDQQLRRLAARHGPDRYAVFTRRISSCPGESMAALQAAVYRLLGLSEPAGAPPVSPPVPIPTLLSGHSSPAWSSPPVRESRRA
ncbi:hypothetical protein [Actinophytocola sp.]|uniref:hypothetical protein n=1 Tax=Actinophytocola sp. TaxID=1872138 RepID=UPI003899CC73